MNHVDIGQKVNSVFGVKMTSLQEARFYSYVNKNGIQLKSLNSKQRIETALKWFNTTQKNHRHEKPLKPVLSIEEVNFIGKAIKFYRSEKRYSQNWLEAKTDVNRSLISRYERGLDIPTIKTAQKLATALGVDLIEIMPNEYLDRLKNINPKEKAKFNKIEIAERLRKLRLETGMTQVKVADETRIYHGNIAKYERAYSIPNIENIFILSDFYGTTVDYILKGNSTLSDRIELKKNKIASLFKMTWHCPDEKLEMIELFLKSVI